MTPICSIARELLREINSFKHGFCPNKNKKDYKEVKKILYKVYGKELKDKHFFLKKTVEGD